MTLGNVQFMDKNWQNHLVQNFQVVVFSYIFYRFFITVFIYIDGNIRHGLKMVFDKFTILNFWAF